MNPFQEKPMHPCDCLRDWKQIYPKAYDKNETDPYTKVRIILANGAEFEANWFSHQLMRHCGNNDLRREVSLIRRLDKGQQMMLDCLKPKDETLLETTIGYEQLAVDLTALLARREKDPDFKMALDFALLEDFDHLYRYADLLDMERGIHAERLVGNYTEIMPGRPTIAEHRYPADNVRRPLDFKKADPMTRLAVSIITAAEQQTMNYYMNIAGFYDSDLGRQLYQEIGLIEEQHVTQYESFLDPNCTWLESLLMHEYTESYVYYSCSRDESDPHIKKVFERCFEEEITHLHEAARLLEKYEKKDWKQVIPDGNFPEPMKFGDNIEYVRKVIADTVQLTSVEEDYVPVAELPDDANFFVMQNAVNHDVKNVPSHKVIVEAIRARGEDYRFETAEHPIDALRDRKKDNTTVGRTK